MAFANKFCINANSGERYLLPRKSFGADAIHSTSLPPMFFSSSFELSKCAHTDKQKEESCQVWETSKLIFVFFKNNQPTRTKYIVSSQTWNTILNLASKWTSFTYPDRTVLTRYVLSHVRIRHLQLSLSTFHKTTAVGFLMIRGLKYKHNWES